VFIGSSNESHSREVEQLVRDLMNINIRPETTSSDSQKAKKTKKTKKVTPRKPLQHLQPDVQKPPQVNKVANRTRPTDNIIQSPPEPGRFVTCHTCGSAEKCLRMCSGCRRGVYCSTECQLLAWPNHRSACKSGRRTCVTCGSTEKRLKLCSGCRSVRYCSAECQLQAWPEHRAACLHAARFRTCAV
jgi:hypothetical protein